MTSKLSPQQLRDAKGGTPIVMLTAYDAPTAHHLEQVEIPVILVGDTVGMVEMGFSSTRDVTVEHIEYHLGAVRRGAPNTHVIGDLPHLSYEDPEQAVANARRLVAAGADSVKLEGVKLDAIAAIRAAGIEVVGHTGLTPQTAQNFKQVGRDSEDARRILDEAKLLANADCFMLVLEHIPAKLAADITTRLTIPTIGIGAGAHCDGQVLVINDVLGLGTRWPPFSKQYRQLGDAIEGAAAEFAADVRGRRFPGDH